METKASKEIAEGSASKVETSIYKIYYFTFPFAPKVRKTRFFSLSKPLILKPRLQNKLLDYDNLKLERLLRDNLVEASFVATKGDELTRIVFVDTDDMPDAIIPAGSYEVEGDIIKARINLIRNDKVLKVLTVEGNKNNLSELVNLMINQIIETASELKLK